MGSVCKPFDLNHIVQAIQPIREPTARILSIFNSGIPGKATQVSADSPKKP